MFRRNRAGPVLSAPNAIAFITMTKMRLSGRCNTGSQINLAHATTSTAILSTTRGDIQMALPDALQIPYSKAVVAATDPLGMIVVEDLIQILEDEWCATYYSMSGHNPCAMRVPDQEFTFLYDQASANANDVDDRLVAAHGRSATSMHKRDKNRQRGFLGGRIDVPGKGKFDKGHALSHAMGGGLDVNLFPQRPELNLGRSEAGRVYRRIERYGSDHPGTFVFSRLIYTDNSWVPSSLEYGVLMPDGKLWVEWFEN